MFDLKFVSLKILLFAALFMTGCSHVNDGMIRGRKAINATLDVVEREMDDNAAYADSLVQFIDSHSIRNKEQRARYALLYTAAEYKNFQPLTSDSLIMEAVRYYSIRDNMDYRFLSYYYLGCAYLDMGQMTDASVAFAQAEQLVDRIDNDYWKGLLYSRLGYIFNESLDVSRAADYYAKSKHCFELAEKTVHIIYVMYEIVKNKMYMHDFKAADSITILVEDKSLAIGDSSLYKECLYNRLYCYLYLNEIDSATSLLNKYSLEVEDTVTKTGYLEMMAFYYNSVKNYAKSESYLNKVRDNILSETDSLYLYYYSSLLWESKGHYRESLDDFRNYTSLQIKSLRSLLNQPIAGAQRDYYRTLSELEAIKARNRVTMLVASIFISLLIISYIFLVSLSRKRKVQQEIRDYLSTIDDLTARESESQDKISSLNGQIREMLRQQFSPSDYLYTRYYEQIDDNKKAERLFRVVKGQIDQFTGPKSISRIDELLNKTFDGIMDKISSSGLDIKEKDLLLLRFVLAGFSAKSMAAILGDTHVNITQRKKRLLDKIQNMSPDMMKELRSALNTR